MTAMVRVKEGGLSAELKQRPLRCGFCAELLSAQKVPSLNAYLCKAPSASIAKVLFPELALPKGYRPRGSAAAA